MSGLGSTVDDRFRPEIKAIRSTTEEGLGLQQFRGARVSKRTGDVSRSLSPIILEVAGGAAADQELQRRIDVLDARGLVVARRPHERGEAMRVAAVDVDARVEQQGDDR